VVLSSQCKEGKVHEAEWFSLFTCCPLYYSGDFSVLKEMRFFLKMNNCQGQEFNKGVKEQPIIISICSLRRILNLFKDQYKPNPYYVKM
jgi:hypothetical protein